MYMIVFPVVYCSDFQPTVFVPQDLEEARYRSRLRWTEQDEFEWSRLSTQPRIRLRFRRFRPRYQSRVHKLLRLELVAAMRV